MDDNGWIKIDRSILESDVFDNPNLLKFWIWCLCKAAYKSFDRKVGNRTIKIKPGQFITGRKKISEELNISESTASRYIKLFVSDGRISTRATNKYTVITIEKWGQYQVDSVSVDNKRYSNGHSKEDNKRHTVRRINKKDKKEKNNTSDLPEKEMTEEEEFEMRAREFERLKANGTI